MRHGPLRCRAMYRCELRRMVPAGTEHLRPFAGRSARQGEESSVQSAPSGVVVAGFRNFLDYYAHNLDVLKVCIGTPRAVPQASGSCWLQSLSSARRPAAQSHESQAACGGDARSLAPSRGLKRFMQYLSVSRDGAAFG